MSKGKHNTGHWNTGYYNTGDHNPGDKNTGHWNTGYCNTGSHNSGDKNTGSCNTGSCNTGSWNTGGCNTGRCNTGSCNTGNCNTGYGNTGYCNTGNWNTGNWNTGYCNSITPEECLIFNKPAKRKDWEDAVKPGWMNISLTKWIEADEMTEKEKEAYPSYVTTGGYLKCYSDLKAAYIESWENTTEADRKLTKKLPNFDPKVFEEVFGFNPFRKEIVLAKLDEIITLNRVKYKRVN